ncbi:hypothetical protein BC828DRAFT_389035 [Blastocladiella britannica]|nr:hypothetical protein BC828DRAFT_389035 [Blastocladiella britannica]
MPQVFAYTENRTPWAYLQFQLSRPLALLEVRHLIQTATSDTLGFVGGSLPVDVLALHSKNTLVTIRVPFEHGTEIWAALTLVATFNGAPIKITAVSAQSSPLAISAPVKL